MIRGRPWWTSLVGPASGRWTSAWSSLGPAPMKCSRDREPGLQGLGRDNDELPPGQHYGPGGDAFLVGLVVGEGDGLVIRSSTW
jgi:hypothetical protein